MGLLIVNASFVGGLGGARKAVSFSRHLRNRGIAFKLVTDSQSLGKLRLFGLEPEVVFPVHPTMSASDIYAQVREAMRAVSYDAMVSFGWRTFVPADAVWRSKPVVIVDGGWPRSINDWPSPFCREVYEKLAAYCLTNWFCDHRLDGLLPGNVGINFQWIAQPLDEVEIAWHLAVAEYREDGRDHSDREGAPRRILLDMNPDYIDPRQGTFTAGWLTPGQLDECRGFVSRLLVELDSAKEPLELIMHEEISREFAPVRSRCHNLKVTSHKSLPPSHHHRLRVESDLSITRATRCVGTTQAALSQVPTLHAVCPATDDYMGERSSCRIAERLGIAASVDHEAECLQDGIIGYLNSDRARETARLAQSTALSFWRERGPDFLLELLGFSSQESPATAGRERYRWRR